MTNKHFNWHKGWSRLPSGRLRHISGLEFEVDDVLGVCTCDDTLAEFSRHESARGVPLWQHQERIMRLTREAAEWNEANP
jgi:hypothetical protein